MSTIVLGRGHVGQALCLRHNDFLFTKRKKSHPGTLVFDLANRGTWKSVPKVESVVWTFPATPPKLVAEFYDERLSEVKNLVVLASTSCYVNKRQGEKIDEKKPLNMGIQRVQGEEFLRDQGATVLCLAGIYDGARNPLNWLKKGLIRNPRKIVNLIHTDNIIEVIEFMLAHPQPGERFNICDGQPRTWQEIGDRVGFEFRMEGEREVSKRLSNEKIKSVLPKDFKFKPLFDLWE